MSIDETTTPETSISALWKASVNRRKVLVFLLFTGIGAVLYKFASLVFRFLKPLRRADEFGGIITVGPVHELPAMGAAPLLQPKGRFWLVHDEDGISAIHSSCTHLECLFGWDTEKQVFVCPCHGSEFNRSGRVLRGPADRDLDRFPLQVVDDQDHVIAHSPPETADPVKLDTLLPDMGDDRDTEEQQKRPLFTLQVDTGRKISGAGQDLR